MKQIALKKKKVVFVSFPHFSHEISLVRTGLLEALIQKGYCLVIFVGNNSQRSRLEEYFAGQNVQVVAVNEPHKYSFIEAIIYESLYRKYITKMPPERRKVIQGPQARNKRKSVQVITKYVLKELIVALVLLFPEKNRIALLCRLGSNKEIDLFFARLSPLLTVLSWAGIHQPDKIIFLSAKKYKCRTISIDACWDLMEDATWAPILDKLLVWNEEMRSEAIQYHGYPLERVNPVGILRCDFYRRKEFLLSKKAFFEKYRLDEKRRLIAVALNSICPIEVWRKVIETISRAKNICYPVQIFVRLCPCPYMKREQFKDVLNEPFIRIEEAFSGEHLVSREEIMRLVNLPAHTDILISLLSTLILESFYFDKPNISLAFEPLRHLYKRDFLQPFLLQKGIRIAYDEEGLINAINAYLLNPELDKEARKETLEKFCFGSDGRVTERVLFEIEKSLAPSRLS